MGIKSSQRGNKKKLGYFLIETKPLILATTRRRVCCVYVKARIVYVACMLKTSIFLVYKGVSSEIRVCCANFVNSKIELFGFALRYLWF